MLDLSKILKFVYLLNKFQQVRRVIRVPGEDRWENDTEHSYNLTMLAWYIIQSHDLKLDTDKILQYALVHDFVEVHAGDTYIFTSNELEKKSKILRENEAANKLQKDFPDFKDLHNLIHQYEKSLIKKVALSMPLIKLNPY